MGMCIAYPVRRPRQMATLSILIAGLSCARSRQRDWRPYILPILRSTISVIFHKFVMVTTIRTVDQLSMSKTHAFSSVDDMIL